MRLLAVFAAVALLAGCDALFGLTRIPPTGDGADGGAVDAAGCQPQIIHDDFTGTALCGTWGTPSGLQATEGKGQLVIQPVPNVGGSQGGCFARAPVAFDDSGVFIKVVAVPEQSGSTGTGGTYMFLDTRDPSPSDAVVLRLSVGGGMLVVQQATQTLGTVAYDPVQMAWWRIRPDRALPGVVADVSPDGFAWQTIGSAAGPIPTSVILEFTAGEYGVGVGDPGMAVIEDFNVCPG